MSQVVPLTVRAVDPVAVPGGLAAIARDAGLAPKDLATGGAVIVEVGGRRRVVDIFELARIDVGPGGAPVVEQLAIERALSGALAALSVTRPLTACMTTGHGELPVAQRDARGADWTAVSDRLRGDGMVVAEVDVTGEVPPTCTVLVVAGPATPLTPAEALAVQAYVRRGGGLLVAAPSRALASGSGALGATGLEGVLAADGLGLPPAIAVDPALAVRELPGALLVIDGYADSPINAGFARTRPTIWFQPRQVVAGEGAHPLVSATGASWGETDLVSAPPVKQETDLAGPVAVAARGSTHRVIAVGSAESLSSAILAGGASAADLWLARAVRHLAALPDPSAETVSRIAARAPDQVRLVLSAGERRAVIALSVGGIPLTWLIAGGLVVWLRRRRAR
jgi:hypothetical protein